MLHNIEQPHLIDWSVSVSTSSLQWYDEHTDRMWITNLMLMEEYKFHGIIQRLQTTNKRSERTHFAREFIVERHADKFFVCWILRWKDESRKSKWNFSTVHIIFPSFSPNICHFSIQQNFLESLRSLQSFLLSFFRTMFYGFCVEELLSYLYYFVWYINPLCHPLTFFSQTFEANWIQHKANWNQLGIKLMGLKLNNFCSLWKGCKCIVIECIGNKSLFNRFFSWEASEDSRRKSFKYKFNIKVHHWSTLIFNLCFHEPYGVDFSFLSSSYFACKAVCQFRFTFFERHKRIDEYFYIKPDEETDGAGTDSDKDEDKTLKQWVC